MADVNKKSSAAGLALTALLIIVVWQLPFGGYLLYPLTILATWFHEMGHGLCALMLGGSFHRLELFGSGSGLAFFSGDLFLGQIGMALVAAAGPLGPALAGSALILSSRRAAAARGAIFGLTALMVLSVIFWVRTGFGIAMISLIAGLLCWTAFKGSARLHVRTVQFLGINASISVYHQLDYLFTHRIVINGRVLYSDTGQMAEALFLPFWFWALLLAFLTLLLPYLSLRRALK